MHHSPVINQYWIGPNFVFIERHPIDHQYLLNIDLALEILAKKWGIFLPNIDTILAKCKNPNCEIIFPAHINNIIDPILIFY